MLSFGSTNILKAFHLKGVKNGLCLTENSHLQGESCPVTAVVCNVEKEANGKVKGKEDKERGKKM